MYTGRFQYLFKKVKRSLGISLEKLRFPENFILRIPGKTLHSLALLCTIYSREVQRFLGSLQEVEKSFEIYLISRKFARTKLSNAGTEKMSRILENSQEF